MAKRDSRGASKNLGAISMRFAGTDGVSLEMGKWAEVLEEMGHTCFYFAGELDRPTEKSMLVPEAHFSHLDIRDIYSFCFNERVRKPGVTKRIHELTAYLKEKIYEFIDAFEIDCLILQNALTIPLNIPLGIAITEVLAETGIPAIAHHHDFFWERKRFLVNAVWDYLNMAFPPHLPNIHHVVINSSAANQLALRTGIAPMLIPNDLEMM